MSTAVIDLDGVIADARHRLYLIQRPRGEKDWDTFYALCGEDPLLTTGYDLACALAVRNSVVYLTGRRESCRDDTLTWFDRHGIPDGLLLMRGEHDYRPAAVLKLELLQELEDVFLVVDDDSKVCDALEAAGYRVLQATWARAEGA